MENPFKKRAITKPLDDVTTRPHTISVTLPDRMLTQVYTADDEQSALDAAQQIPDIDTARRICAYVDIYATFEGAMNETSLQQLKEIIVGDLLQFAGKRLPSDTAQKVGVPKDFIETSDRTGVVDYADIQASFRVWDELERGTIMKDIIDAFIEQFSTLSAGNARQAALLKKAFSLSVENGTKVASNERDLLRQLQSTGSVNRFNDDEAQIEALRIAAERDRVRQLGSAALQPV